MPLVSRHIRIVHGPPWGFQVIDGPAGHEIGKIDRSGGAEVAGLREGDLLDQVNGFPVEQLNHREVMHLVEQAVNDLSLDIRRHESRGATTFVFKPARPDLVAEQPTVGVSVEIPAGEKDVMLRPSSPDVAPVLLSRLLQPAEQEAYPTAKKKVYGDSTFYGENTYFPSVEEQMEIAKRVACSLTDHINLNSRGAAMFNRRKNRARKWTTKNRQASESDPENNADSEHEEESEAFSDQHAMGGVPVMYGADLETTIPDDAPLPIPPPPPIPVALGYPSMVPDYRSNVPPPPPVPFGAVKTEKEFLEKIRAYPRSKHNIVEPEKCFDIAQALHTSSSRGAQIFNKRKARAKKWEVDSEKENLTAVDPGEMKPMSGPISHPKITSKLQPTTFSMTGPNQHDSRSNPYAGYPEMHMMNSSNSSAGSAPSNSVITGFSNSTSPGSSATNVGPSSPSSSSNTSWRPVSFNLPSKAKPIDTCDL